MREVAIKEGLRCRQEEERDVSKGFYCVLSRVNKVTSTHSRFLARWTPDSVRPSASRV